MEAKRLNNGTVNPLCGVNNRPLPDLLRELHVILLPHFERSITKLWLSLFAD
jgi:hypothetical protein